MSDSKTKAKPDDSEKKAAQENLLRGAENAGGENIIVNREQLIKALKS